MKNFMKNINLKRAYYKFKYRKIDDKYRYEITDLLNNNKVVGSGVRNFYDIIYFYELLPINTGLYVEKLNIERKKKNV